MNTQNMNEYDKIIATVKAMGAKDFESAVSMEQIIAKGIELGYTEDYKTENWEGYQEGDHPWWTKAAVLMGIGNESAVEQNEDIYLHRQKVNREGYKSKIMVYWYDQSQRHKVVNRSRKANGSKKLKKTIEQETHGRVVDLNQDQKAEKVSSNPEKYRMVNGKIISEEWIATHQEKFKQLYGQSI